MSGNRGLGASSAMGRASDHCMNLGDGNHFSGYGLGYGECGTDPICSRNGDSHGGNGGHICGTKDNPCLGHGGAKCTIADIVQAEIAWESLYSEKLPGFLSGLAGRIINGPAPYACKLSYVQSYIQNLQAEAQKFNGPTTGIPEPVSFLGTPSSSSSVRSPNLPHTTKAVMAAAVAAHVVATDKVPSDCHGMIGQFSTNPAVAKEELAALLAENTARRQIEVWQITTLYNNLVNAYDTMANSPSDVCTQLANLESLANLLAEFSLRPCSGKYHTQTVNLKTLMNQLHIKLHNKLNGFINWPDQSTSFGIYMHSWALPAAKQYLGGQQPTWMALFTPAIAKHWLNIYTIASNNAIAGLKVLKDMHVCGSLTFEKLVEYMKLIYPNITPGELNPLYTSLMAGR
jgi:hypothetical protein